MRPEDAPIQPSPQSSYCSSDAMERCKSTSGRSNSLSLFMFLVEKRARDWIEVRGAVVCRRAVVVGGVFNDVGTCASHIVRVTCRALTSLLFLHLGKDRPSESRTSKKTARAVPWRCVGNSSFLTGRVTCDLSATTRRHRTVCAAIPGFPSKKNIYLFLL